MEQSTFNEFLRFYIWWFVLGVVSLVIGAVPGQGGAFAVGLIAFLVLTVGGVPVCLFGAVYEARRKRQEVKKST